MRLVRNLHTWRLFGLLAGVNGMGVLASVPGTDFRSKPSVEALILTSILWALPWLIAAFLATPIATVWPSRVGRSLVQQRRYLGLAFALGLVWHLVLVGYFIATFGYDLEPQDIALDVAGVLFLAAMTITSFPATRRRLSLGHWRRLHTTGIYLLWLLPTVFFWEDYQHDHSLFHGIAVAVLLGVGVVRVIGRRAAP